MAVKKPEDHDTVVSSVRLPRDLRDKAKDLGLGLGVVLRKALMEQLTVEGEKEILRNRIEEKYQEIEYLDQRLRDLEKLESKADQEIWDQALEAIRDEYSQKQAITNNRLLYWCLKLRVEQSELITILEDEVAGGMLTVI